MLCPAASDISRVELGYPSVLFVCLHMTTAFLLIGRILSKFLMLELH